MPETIFIGVAWPYANGPLHLGHIAGCYLPADIFARYHRMKGNRVLMVSGSDQHGTPNTLRAEQEGVTPDVVVDRYHRSFLSSWERLGIQFDLFTTTRTENHRQVVHDLFLTLQQNGLIYPGTMPLPYCPVDRRFLADRYVEGTCPHCGYPRARGDQCESCGKPTDPVALGDLRCRFCGASPEIRDSDHLFLRLNALQDRLLEWVRRQTHWRSNVLNFTTRFLEEGLHDRAITRDIDWGVPLPLPGYDTKRIYVWFEAVIGYLSAAKEWAQLQGEPDAWKEFWQNGNCRAYYFIGKDNIVFHTIIWPAMLMGYGDLSLPYDVPANEFLNLEGRKLSTSDNWAVWLPDYLDRFEPDPLRYCLSATMPESFDTDFSWREFVRRNNDELVATYGNLVHRVLTLIHRNFQACVPTPGELDDADQGMLAHSHEAIDQAGRHLEACRFREALRQAMALAQEANAYVNDKEPWRTVRENPSACATTLWVSLNVLSALKTITYPFLPFGAQRLHRLLGLDGEVSQTLWGLARPEPGRALPEPHPLFAKLDDAVAEEEVQRLHRAAQDKVAP